LTRRPLAEVFAECADDFRGKRLDDTAAGLLVGDG
jgi:hypothetical protein